MNYKKYKSIKISILKTKRSNKIFAEKDRPVRKMNDGSYGIVYNNQVFKLHQPNIIYLDDKCPNDPDIMMSWAKIYVCLGNYDNAIKKYQEASRLYMDFGRTDWQLCEAQIQGIKNRFNEPELFKDFVVAASGNSISRQDVIL